MPRIPREFLISPNLSFHKIWKSHNKEWNLASPEEKQKYLYLLNDSFPSQSCKLFAFCIMSNHAHEIYQANNIPIFSNFMRKHHMRYGQFFNHIHHRCGKVANDRPKTHTFADDHREMISTFYIHANPIRANIVKNPKNYLWSTYAWYAFGKKNKWTQHCSYPDWYMRLGTTWILRQKNYRKLFDQYLRKEGLIQQQPSVYGIGPLPWIQVRRQSILQKMKIRYGPPPFH